MSTFQLQFSIDDLSRGEAIVAELLERRLVACAQTLGAIRSRYWWQGTLESADEWLFLCKTSGDRLDEAIEHIRSTHPYELPEIVACEISAGYSPYLAWISDETRRREG